MKKFLLSIYLLLTLPIFSAIGAPAETITHWVDYRVMPTYFGIPLVDTNASFYTLTNKIAVLDVRVTNLEAQTNSYASIYSLNQLSNRVVTLEGQTNSYALKTITNDLNNISSNLLVETSRATNAEYALNLKIGITSNYFYNYATNLEGLININSNQTFLYYTNVLQLLYNETNRANSVETNLQGQITSATNRIRNLEGQTNSYAPKSITNDVNSKVSSNELASTTINFEGIRRVGALGGYNLAKFFEDTYPKGISRDLVIFTHTNYPSTNLVVSWTGGDVYSPEDGYYHIANGTYSNLLPNAVNYAYWQNNFPHIVQWTSGSFPIGDIFVLARFVTAFGSIIEWDYTTPAGDFVPDIRHAFGNILPSLITSENGLVVKMTGTNLNQIEYSDGIEYQNLETRVEHGLQNLSDTNTTLALIAYGHTNSVFAYTITNELPVGLWDDGTNVISCNPSNWYRGVFVSIPNSHAIHWVYPQFEYTNETEAFDGSDPSLPLAYIPYIPVIAAYIFQGSDTNLRTESKYTLDRRLMIRRSAIVSGGGGGGSGVTPTLNQVLAVGKDAGGYTPYNLGNPTDFPLGQAVHKQYVDSNINNVNTHRAYVDMKGDDNTAQLESSINPFRTIQAAIDAASAMADVTNRYSVSISAGIYAETNITMANFISLVGIDIESTIIDSTITYPPTFTDIAGSELALLTIRSIDTPAIVINLGQDEAYAGIRSCYLIADYNTPNITKKSVILVQRGSVEMYGTTYNELNINTNDSYICRVQISEHTTDTNNQGLSEFTSFNSSSVINCKDVNDDISMMFTHDNTDDDCQNTLLAGKLDIYLQDTVNIHSNDIKLISHKKATGRTLFMSNVVRLTIPETNNCNAFMAVSTEGTGENVAIVRGAQVKISGGTTTNIWLGAATSTNDCIRVYDSIYVQNLIEQPYPRIYTNNGADGKFFINTVTESGDHLFGGTLDIAAINTSLSHTPADGHLKIYVEYTSGGERLFVLDSKGNAIGIGRDNILGAINGEANTLQRGELIYAEPSNSTTNYVVKRAKANSINTMAAYGIVDSPNGILPNTKGMIKRFGKAEYINTASFGSGDKIYVSATVAGGYTNVAPTGTNIAQIIGYCDDVNITNGSINLQFMNPDTLGNQTPSYYASVSNLYAETNRAISAETNLQGQITSATNRISILEGQTNTYATTTYVSNSIAWMPSYHSVSNFSAFLIGKTNQIPYGVEHGYLDLTTNTVIYMNTNNISTNTADTFAVDIYLNGFTLTCDNVTLTNTMSSMSGTMNTIIFRKGYRQSMYYGVGKVIQP